MAKGAVTIAIGLHFAGACAKKGWPAHGPRAGRKPTENRAMWMIGLADAGKGMGLRA